MILRFILFALGIYIIYKLVFDLIIPVFRTTQKIRQQFGDMHDQMNNVNKPNGYNSQNRPAAEPKNNTSKPGDYIDFEEVK